MTIDVRTLFFVEAASKIFSTGLELAQAVGLPVTSWRTGDPTKAAFKYLARVLAARESVTAEYIKAGFLSTAEGDWLHILADEVYNVQFIEASYATSTVTVRNDGGGFYGVEPGDVTFKSSASGKTYHCTNAASLAPTDVVAFDVIADESGSDSSAGVDEIDTIVTTLLGVVVLGSTAAVGRDEEEDEALRDRCRATRGALSPNGPPDAYQYVVTSPALTGVTDITRAEVSAPIADGSVTIYVASPSGPVIASSVTAAQDAVELWATPIGTTPTVVSASPLTQNVAATVSGENIPADFAARIATALGVLFARLKIGRPIALSEFTATIRNELVAMGATGISVVVTTPAATVTPAAYQVLVLGTVSIVEVA